MTGAYSGISATVTHFITHDGIDYAPERSRHAHIAANPASSQIPPSEILLPPLPRVNLQTSAREYALEAARMGYIVANPLFQIGVGHAHRNLNMLRGSSAGRCL